MEKGKKILTICMIAVFVSFVSDLLISPISSSFFLGLLLVGLFFSLTYHGHNWARICLFIFLLANGLGGLYGGSMILLKYHHHAGILIVIMSLVSLFIGFILLLNKSVKSLAKQKRITQSHPGSPQKVRNESQEIINPEHWVDVNWKKRIAKEWLWFICTVGTVLLSWTLLFFFAPDAKVVEDFWGPLFDLDHDRMLLAILPILLLYFIRLTIWAVKQLRTKETGNK